MPVLLLGFLGFLAAAKLLVHPPLATLPNLPQHTRLFNEMPLLRYSSQSECDADKRSAAVAGKDWIATLVRFAQRQPREMLAVFVDGLALTLLSVHDLTNVLISLDRLGKTAQWLLNSKERPL